MSDGLAQNAGRDVWSNLLGVTRDALTNLRADELENLVEYAEKLTKVASEQVPQKDALMGPHPQSAAFTREHRLLADLLHATDRNLQVLKGRHAPTVSRKG